MKDKYCLLFKTGDAELRALENLWFESQNIFPIIELTRGRKSKIETIGKIEKRLNKIESLFHNKEICLDLTTSPALTNEEIIGLYDFKNGYKKWVEFLIKQKGKKIYKNIIPNILVDTNDTNIERNLRLQVEKLSNEFLSIAYRNDLADDGCYEDLEMIKSTINKSNANFYFILDCEYIAPGSWHSYANKINIRISKIQKIIPQTKFIIVSTSFPKYVSDIGRDDNDTFGLNEIDLFNSVSSVHGVKDIFYGDYGSINPVRNDLVTMSRGWIPRIDVPLATEIFYHRLRRENRDYSETYIELAHDYIIVDKRFPKKLNKNWGIKQILSCAAGNSPGSSPSFWISVRMNIHIEQQLRRLGYL